MDELIHEEIKVNMIIDIYSRLNFREDNLRSFQRLAEILSTMADIQARSIPVLAGKKGSLFVDYVELVVL